MQKENIRQISNYIFEIPKSNQMRVPARIFISKNLLDNINDESLKQIQNVASLPSIIKYAVAMPDIHQGYGFPIGGVGVFDSKTGIITPGGIGFDINCGVRTLVTNLTKEDVENKMKELLKSILDNVSIGVNSQSKYPLSNEELNEVLTKGINWSYENNYATKEDITNCEENGCMNGANPKKVSQKAKSRAKNHLGTLGSGNHFIEIQIVEEIFDENIAKAFSLEKNQILIMIHSGSRGLGHQVAKDYIEKIDKTYNLDIPDKNLCYAPINSLIGQDYLSAMKCCANFAWANRQMMTYHIREALKKVFLKSEAKLLYDVCHNIAKFETHIIDGKKMELCVHRKGATRAFPPNHSQIPQKYKKVGQPVILPGSMGTNSYILAGQEESMQKTFGSCAHGSGRAYSRSLAQETFKIEEIKSDLKSKEIAVLGPDNKVLLQEGPSAYKNINDVVEVIKAENIAKPVAKLRPIGVIKG